MMDVLKNAVRNLWRKRLRTLLTMCGIIIGVALVAVVAVIGSAGQTTVNAELESMGLGGLSVTTGGSASLQSDSLAAVRAMEEVASAVPLMLDTSALSMRDGTSQMLMLCGIDSGEVQAIGLTTCYGRLLTVSEVRSCARVCVVDVAVAQALYERSNIVGTAIMLPVGGVEEAFTVVGVTKAGSTLLQNVAQLIPGMVYIPYTTMQELTGRDSFDQFAVKLIEGADEEEEAAHIEAVLARLGGSDGYSAENLSAQKDKLSGIMDVVTMVLVAISAISLLVAGLSIMTIMMVSVGERTREIGIKKALGASAKDIRREFLAEALLLSVVGGTIGVVIGGGLGWIGLSLFGLGMPSLSMMGWLIVFAGVIGVVFGVYPAAKAARLDPVEALRCE